MIVNRRPMDIKPGWVGEVTQDDLDTYTFLAPLEEWPDDVYVLEEPEP